jgi:hypothetical protein
MSDLFSVSRRDVLKTVSSGFGYLAFSSLAATASAREVNPLAPKVAHFPAKAKRVIFLCMRGGPSHLDTFDYKPALTRDNGKSGQFRGSLLGSPWEFKQQGKSGLWISELLPELGSMADDLCLLRGMHTDRPVHPLAMTALHTGNSQLVRPSLGAWTLYGLGSENESMPGFISINPAPGSAQHYGSAFLPAVYQGTKLGASGGRGRRRSARRGGGSTVPDIKNPMLTSREQRKQIDLIQDLNKAKLKREKHAPAVEGVIESYELAFRMQSEMPDLMELSQESQKTMELYGIDGGPADSFGRQCLLARRLSESGVRFVEVSHNGWDTHRGMDQSLPRLCEQIDKPIAGLLADLKRRKMLDETLVIWSGEFGRTPYAQNGNGRDHNNKGFTSWMAGGGVKGGFSFGATDEHGGTAVEGRCHTHDWHATILHLMGLNHEQLTYRHAGRDFRLTDVAGNVMKDIVA